MATLDGVVPFQISSSSSVKGAPRVLIARFGNGYEQRTKDGINPNLPIWNAVWTNISLANGKLLDDFFNAQIGLRFTWTPPAPFNTSKSYICDVFQLDYLGGLVCSYSATLEQRPTA